MSEADRTGRTRRPPAAAQTDAPARLSAAVLDHLVAGGSPDGSLRALAAAVEVSHSLLLYHFGSTAGLLTAVYRECEGRERDHLARLHTSTSDPIRVMRLMWQHLADPAMWPVYRVGFALRIRLDVSEAVQDDERDAWTAPLLPLIRDLGVPPGKARSEALLWLATCRGLLWELVTGADAARIDDAAQRFFAHYRSR